MNLCLDSLRKVKICGVVKKLLYCNPCLSLTIIAPLSLIFTQVCENMWSVSPGCIILPWKRLRSKESSSDTWKRTWHVVSSYNTHRHQGQKLSMFTVEHESQCSNIECRLRCTFTLYFTSKHPYLSSKVYYSWSLVSMQLDTKITIKLNLNYLKLKKYVVTLYLKGCP